MNRKIVCCACSSDITYTDARHGFRLLLKNEDVRHDPQSATYADGDNYPAIEDDLRFCGLPCLWGWLSTKQDRLAGQWKSKAALLRPKVHQDETVTRMRRLKCPRCGNGKQDDIKSDFFTPAVPNAKAYQRFECTPCGYASYNLRQWVDHEKA